MISNQTTASQMTQSMKMPTKMSLAQVSCKCVFATESTSEHHFEYFKIMSMIPLTSTYSFRSKWLRLCVSTFIKIIFNVTEFIGNLPIQDAFMRRHPWVAQFNHTNAILREVFVRVTDNSYRRPAAICFMRASRSAGYFARALTAALLVVLFG